MKKLTAIVLALVMVLSLAACGSKQETSTPAPTQPATTNTEPTTTPEPASTELTPPNSPYLIQLVGASSGGTFFLAMNGFAQLMNDKAPEWFQASAQSTAGGMEILRLLESDDADFGMGQAGVAKSAIDGTYGDGNQPKLENLASVTYMYPQVMQMIASNASGVEDFTQFADKTFCAGASGSATEQNTKDIYRVLGMEYNSKMQYTSESQSADLMKNGQADGGNMVGPVGSAAMTDLMSTGKFHLVGFTDEQIAELLKISPAFYEFTVPANSYANQPEPVKTFAVANWLYCSKDLDEDEVYTFVKTLYENLDDVHAIHNVLNENFSLENSQDGMTVPMHPGAERYYKEVGILK